MRDDIKDAIRPLIPRKLLDLKRDIYEYLIADDRTVPLDVMKYWWHPRHSFHARKLLSERMLVAHRGLKCAHTHAEITAVARAILDTPGTAPGVVVEAGCFKGGSTAKLSVAAHMAGRRLVVFDSFEGLPEVVAPEERGSFYAGAYAGALDEVRGNVRQYGEIGACEFVKGWFNETLPIFSTPVVVAFVDVDLRDSLQTCLERLYPLLTPGGSIFSHDGHLPKCVDLMSHPELWAGPGVPAPRTYGLGKKKLVRIQKPLQRRP